MNNGFLKLDATLTRTGVFIYKDHEGKTIRELRTPKEVFKAENLDSLDMSPLTLLHPEQQLTPDTFKDSVVGSVANITQDGKFIKASVMIADKDAIQAVMAGVKEISCGYSCDLVFKSGVWNGLEYDAIQTNIINDHVSLVPRGRAGSDVSLHLDSGEYMEDKIEDAVTAQIETEVKTEPTHEDIAKYDELVDALDKSWRYAEEQLDKLQAKYDSLESSIDDKVEALIAMRTKVDGRLPEDTKFDGMSEADIQKAVVTHKYPNLNLDEKSVDYIQARFDAIMEQPIEKVVIDTTKVASKTDSKAEVKTPQTLAQKIEAKNQGK